MNVRIANILKTYIEALNFADLVGGIVKPIEIMQSTEDIRKVPGEYLDATSNDYISYAPDTSRMSIIYFEDQGVDLVRDGSRYIDLVSSLKLVAWFNLDRINHTLVNSDQLMLLIMDAIPKSFNNTNNILKARTEFQGEDPKTPEIFGDYDYDEAILQHLMHPYHYGALNYNIFFSVRPECVPEIVINPAPCITDPNC